MDWIELYFAFKVLAGVCGVTLILIIVGLAALIRLLDWWRWRKIRGGRV